MLFPTPSNASTLWNISGESYIICTKMCAYEFMEVCVYASSYMYMNVELMRLHSWEEISYSECC